MDQQVYFSGELKQFVCRRKEIEIKVLKCFLVSEIRPETKWSNHELVEV